MTENPDVANDENSKQTVDRANTKKYTPQHKAEKKVLAKKRKAVAAGKSEYFNAKKTLTNFSIESRKRMEDHQEKIAGCSRAKVQQEINEATIALRTMVHHRENQRKLFDPSRMRGGVMLARSVVSERHM